MNILRDGGGTHAPRPVDPASAERIGEMLA